MSLTGKVIDGQVVLDAPLALADGTRVRIEPLANGETDQGESAKPEVAEPPLRQLGTMKGTVLYISPDFDAPLEDFKEYME